MIRKKKKTKKTKSSSLKKSKKISKHSPEDTGIDLRADGERFWNSPKGKNFIADVNGDPISHTIVNVATVANNIKSYKDLENFMELYLPTLSPKDIGRIMYDYARDNWMVIKILNNPENLGAVVTFLSEIDNTPGGAVKIYDGHINKENEDVLETFCLDTGYKRPRSIGTFQNDITYMKDHFGLKRKKKINPFQQRERDPFKEGFLVKKKK